MIPGISNFEDLALYVYCTVDDVYKEIAHLFRRPGPQPRCSDAELMTMALVGECKGWDVETELLSNWADHPGLIRHMPSQSRFNRRRKQLALAFNMVRKVVLGMLEMADDRQCVIDSLPVEVLGFHLVPGGASVSEWKSRGAGYGHIASKKKTIFGYKLHLLLTLGGVILDFELAGASLTDLQVGEGLLGQHTDLQVLADKAYISAPIAADLEEYNRLQLLTVPRANQKVQLPPSTARLFGQIRQMIETVNSQLAGQFHVEINHAYSFFGLQTRLYSKLAAHTILIYINRLLGNSDFLHIKQLAFSYSN